MKIKTVTPGVLTVAVYVGFPPFTFRDNNGFIVGTDIQYLEKFVKQHNLVIKFIVVEEFDNIWELPGKNNICDMAASGISLEKIREGESPGTTWSIPYYYVQRSYITLRENSITKAEDFSGKTVVVTKDSTADQDLLEQIQKYNVQNVNIQYSDDEIKSGQLVSEGKVFASGAGLLTNQYAASKYSNTHIQWIHDILLPSGKPGSEPFSFPTRTKSKGLVEELNKFIKENAYDTNVIISVPPPAPAPVLPEFDQVVKGNVDIKQLSKKKYKITFSKIGKFLLYQVWSDSSKKLNENRSVYYRKAKKWVQDFNKLNDSLKASNKLLFTPTTVMEIGNNKYVFVIHKAKLNGKGRVVFKVSTKEIKLSSGTSKKMLKLPRGHHDGVRFDIDSDASVCNTLSGLTEEDFNWNSYTYPGNNSDNDFCDVVECIFSNNQTQTPYFFDNSTPTQAQNYITGIINSQFSPGYFCSCLGVGIYFTLPPAN